MGAPAGNQNGKGGKKGNRGRKSLSDEIVRAAVIDKSWGLLNKVLDGEYHFDDEKKVFIARDIAVKTIPKDVNVKTKDIDNLLDNLYGDNGQDKEDAAGQDVADEQPVQDS